MAATAYSVGTRHYGVKLVISAAINSALSFFSTTETVQIDQVVRNVVGADLTRTVNETYVTGADNPILDYETRIQRAPLVITALYTEGDDLGTDDWDLHEGLMAIAEYTTSDLSLQVIYAPKGFTTGNFQYTTSATESFITNVGAIEGGADATGRVSFPFSIKTTTITKGLVS